MEKKNKYTKEHTKATGGKKLWYQRDFVNIKSRQIRLHGVLLREDKDSV